MLFKLFLIFCLYLPFQVALSPSTGVDLASARVFILLIFFSWLAKSLKNRRLLLQNNKANFFLACFLFLNLVSLTVAQNTDWSVRKLLFLFSIFPLYFAVSFLVDTEEKMEKTLKFLVWGGFFVALLGLFQFSLQFMFGLDSTYQFWAKHISPLFLGQNVTEAVLKNPSWLVNISGKTYLRAIGTFPDPHMLSFFLGMLLPFSAGLFLKSKNKTYLVIFFVLLATDLLTFSRGGYLGIFAGAIVTSAFLIARLKLKYKPVVIFLALLASITLFVPSPVSERFFSSFNLKEGSNRGRLETWQKAVEVIINNPLIGTGIGNYSLEISPTADYRDPIYAHSNYLDIAAETGIPSLLAWLGFSLSIFGAFLKRAKNSLFFCAMISVVIFSVHSLVETSIYSPTVLPLFLIIAGFIYLAQSDEKTA